MLLEHHEYRRVADVIHTAVIEDGVSSIFGRRPQVAGVSFGVVAHQDAADEHGARARVVGVAVRIFGIPGKITAFPVGGPVDSTDPPVKVVQADCVHEFGVGAVEELLLGHISASAVLLHAVLLPLEHLPQCFVLDPLDILDGESPHGAVEQLLYFDEFGCGFCQLHSLASRFRSQRFVPVLRQSLEADWCSFRALDRLHICGGDEFGAASDHFFGFVLLVCLDHVLEAERVCL